VVKLSNPEPQQPRHTLDKRVLEIGGPTNLAKDFDTTPWMLAEAQ
jgi:hypothetical protein